MPIYCLDNFMPNWKILTFTKPKVWVCKCFSFISPSQSCQEVMHAHKQGGFRVCQDARPNALKERIGHFLLYVRYSPNKLYALYCFVFPKYLWFSSKNYPTLGFVLNIATLCSLLNDCSFYLPCIR